MNSFFGFENGSEVNYFFNENHLLILLISLVIIILLSMYATRQKLKFQKIFVFIIGIFIVGLEVSRIIWRYQYIIFNGLDRSFLNVVNFDLFTISLWISLPLIFASVFLKKEHTINTFGLHFVFSVATLAGIMSMIYPTSINIYFEFYHFYNLAFVLLRSFVVMLGLFYAFAKWIKVSDFLDLWKALFSLVVLGIVCVGLYFCLGQQSNLFYIKFFPLFYDLGMYLPFPWHLFVMAMFLFIFQILLFIPFWISRYFKYKFKRYED